MNRTSRLNELTARWRTRRAARRGAAAGTGDAREPAEPERLERATRLFPYRTTSPAEYVALHAEAMVAYTYDDYTYPDAQLQAWIDEVGRLLRQRRGEAE